MSCIPGKDNTIWNETQQSGSCVSNKQLCTDVDNVELIIKQIEHVLLYLVQKDCSCITYTLFQNMKLYITSIV